MRIIGIDPGYAIVGYGVVDYGGNRFSTVEYGAVTTQAGTDFPLRLQEIYAGVEEILRRTGPQAMAVEQLFFTNNKTTGIAVAEARGVILLAASRQGIPVFEYTPVQVKQAVVGYGRAVKSQVQEMTKRLLGLPRIPKPDDTADALAIAICHAHCGGSDLSRRIRQGSI
ncbi:MAG TPA: crossover junction endodeoxyribonuclease RuvC [Firmicutes bacterium]|nr:crossover junction endodeoxyribonuclease RuvC [Bacillota bacterium]